MWKFLIKQFNPDKPSEDHKVIHTYMSPVGAQRRALNEKGFHYVEPVFIPEQKSNVSKS